MKKIEPKHLDGAWSVGTALIGPFRFRLMIGCSLPSIVPAALKGDVDGRDCQQ
jgi:hypothetical protein